MGGLTASVLIKFTLTSSLIFYALPPAPCATGEAQLSGQQLMDLVDLCLNQYGGRPFSLDPSCCRAINSAIQAGYNFFCSFLLMSHRPELLARVSASLSGCYISVPPLTLCRAVAPIPITVPPESPYKDVTRPTPPESLAPAPPPRGHKEELASNYSTTCDHYDCSPAMAERQLPDKSPMSVDQTEGTDCISFAGEGSTSMKYLFHPRWFLVSLYCCLFFFLVGPETLGLL